MEEYAKNYYRRMYSLEDKDTIIELLLNEIEKVNTQRAIEVEAQWISKYDELNKNCYLFSAALKEENQQLLRDNLELQKTISELLKERDEDGSKKRISSNGI